MEDLKYYENNIEEMPIDMLRMEYQKAKTELKIVDEYAKLLWQILCDYDGMYDAETKKGSLEGLVGLIDETIEFCDKILKRDTKSVMFFGRNGKKYNILYDEILDKK